MPLQAMRQIDSKVFGLGMRRVSHGTEEMDQLNVLLSIPDGEMSEEDKQRVQRRLANRFGLSEEDMHIFVKKGSGEVEDLDAAAHSYCPRWFSSFSIAAPASGS